MNDKVQIVMAVKTQIMPVCGAKFFQRKFAIP
jgi:hypothetical protein